MSQEKLWIILQDHDLRKRDLPHGILETVEELESIVRETFKLEGNFTLHYKDAEFGEEYFSLNSTRDIKDRDTIKVFHNVEPPTFTLSFADMDHPLESVSKTSITSTDASSVPSSEISICPSTSNWSRSQDTVILSSPEHHRSQPWATEFPIPRFAYDTEFELAAGNEAWNKDGIQLNFTTILPDILEKLAESMFHYFAYPTGTNSPTSLPKRARIIQWNLWMATKAKIQIGKL